MTINDIITDVMKAEGWDKFTNDPADKGGPTKWGITKRAWEDYTGRQCTERDIMAITEGEARKFYRILYVEDPNFHKLPTLLRPLMVDCGVHHGVSRASKWLQKAVGVPEDGVVGPQTLAAVNGALAWDPDFGDVALYSRIVAYRVRLFGVIVSRDPTQARFISGWNNRAAKWLLRLSNHTIAEDPLTA